MSPRDDIEEVKINGKLAVKGPVHSVRDEESMTTHTVASTHPRINSKVATKRENYKQAQVLDVNQALSAIDNEQSKLERELLKKTLNQVKPLLKRVP